MASIKGVTLKKMKRTRGREGYGLLADVYLNGKKVGEFEDYGDGAMGDIHYVSKEMEEAFMHVVYAYGKEHPNEFIVNLYKQDPKRYEEEKKRIRTYFPYITDDEITIESASSNDIDEIIAAVEILIESEKIFKKYVKQGAVCVVAVEDKGTTSFFGYRDVAYAEKHAKNNDIIYRSLDDFKIS